MSNVVVNYDDFIIMLSNILAFFLVSVCVATLFLR